MTLWYNVITMSNEPAFKRMCPAMIDAGIENPESKAGKDFCTEECPYDRCIEMERTRGESAGIRREERQKKALKLLDEGFSIKEVAAKLNLGDRTIARYRK